MRLVTHNLELAGGEIDLVMSDRSQRVAVEVRTTTGPGDPIDAVDLTKRAHVRRLAAKGNIARVDYVGIGFRTWGVEIHWVPG